MGSGLPNCAQAARIFVEELFFPTLEARGGRSRAVTSCVKLHSRCEPSQNGLLADWPQRQRPMEVRPARPNLFPLGSIISKSPSMRIGPLFLKVIFAGICSPLDFLGARYLESSCAVSYLVFRHGRVYVVRPGQNSTF